MSTVGLPRFNPLDSGATRSTYAVSVYENTNGGSFNPLDSGATHSTYVHAKKKGTIFQYEFQSPR